MPYPPGHFYSPVMDRDDLAARQESLWPEALPEVPGVDLDYGGQRARLRSLARFAGDFDYPDARPADAPEHMFYDDNGLFANLDSRLLFGMLRDLRPRRMIEVGSGFSSLLTADVNRRFLNGELHFTCIEPFPRPFLTAGVTGITQLVQQRVELVGLEPFTQLEAGDVLFIDSSHVVKTGNDVVFLYLHVLPRLKPGVVVHVHDIFLPREYPQHWVLEEERSWSEQYLLQAMLMHSTGFAVMVASACVFYESPEVVEEVFGRRYHGGSFWMRRR